MHLKNMPQKRSVKTNLKKGKLFQSEIKLLRKDVKPGPEYDDENSASNNVGTDFTYKYGNFSF